MCNCIEEFEKILLKRFETQTWKKPLKRVCLETTCRRKGNQLVSQTYTKILITLEGQKKQVEQILLHSFCPFCGGELEPTDSEGEGLRFSVEESPCDEVKAEPSV